MAGIALYSSSPPAVAWSTQYSLSNSPATHSDGDTHVRPVHQPSSAARPVVGGLSGLFSRPQSQSPSSASDGLDCSFASSSGMVRSCSLDNLSRMVRSSSQDNLSQCVGHWDRSDGRVGSASVPVGPSFMLKERSPVSVLHGPVPRSNHQNSSRHSLSGWDGVSSTPGLPPLDPHLERHSHKKSVLLTDQRSPMSRSVGFEVGSNTTPVNYQSRVLSSESSATCSNSSSPEHETGNLDHYFLKNDNFLWSTVPTKAVLSKIDGENHAEHQETRVPHTRLVSDRAGTPLTSGTSSLPLSAEEILADAQVRHKIFFDPVVIKAFWLSEEAHRGQVRRSGDLYLVHCVETAILLASTGADSTVVAAGLLHDTLDDSSIDQAQLRALAGDEIESLVSGVSKLSAFSQLARDNGTAGNPEEADRLRTMFLAMVDVRVVLIKLADRLHNLRTLEALPAAKQLRVAKETSEILAPLANKLGIWSWKAEMEDICFRYLKPQEYEELASKMNDGWQEGVVMSSIQQLELALRKEGVEFSDVCGRPKNLYSIYSKMIRKGRNIEEIYDVRGLRLIVKDTDSCYAALDVVHSLWPHTPQKYKDYIAEPKANGYQSLHTVVWGEDGHPLEVQIRTLDMHYQAEFGLAAHWRYKENNCKHSSYVLQKVEWARWVLTWHSEILDTKLRVSPLEAHLRPPCPFPFHKDSCPYADFSSLPPQSDDDPLFVIMLKDENMIVQELAPGSTAADLLPKVSSDRDSISISGKFTSQKLIRPKVNHQFVENFQQKLRMGDLVELTLEPEAVPLMVPLSNRKSELTEAQIASLSPSESCGKIALEFQREQLKRLYWDHGSTRDARSGPSTPQEENASVASLF
ncbi:unnamed protein product [Calypogeia fissa]